jgi:hypothetical protein
MRRTVWTTSLCLVTAAALAQSTPPALARIEGAFADMNDAVGAIGLIDSGYTANYRDRDRAAWDRMLEARRSEVRDGLGRLPIGALSDLVRRLGG